MQISRMLLGGLVIVVCAACERAPRIAPNSIAPSGLAGMSGHQHVNVELTADMRQQLAALHPLFARVPRSRQGDCRRLRVRRALRRRPGARRHGRPLQSECGHRFWPWRWDLCPGQTAVPRVRAAEKRRPTAGSARLHGSLREMAQRRTAGVLRHSIHTQRWIRSVDVPHLAVRRQSGRNVRQFQPDGSAVLSPRIAWPSRIPPCRQRAGSRVRRP